jgi:hypothetical protein
MQDSYLNLIHCFKIQWSLYIPPVTTHISASYLQQISVSPASYKHSNYYLKQHYIFFLMGNFLCDRNFAPPHMRARTHTHTHTHRQTDRQPDKRSGHCRINLSQFKEMFVGLIYIDITKHTHIQTFKVMAMINLKKESVVLAILWICLTQCAIHTPCTFILSLEQSLATQRKVCNLKYLKTVGQFLWK